MKSGSDQRLRDCLARHLVSKDGDKGLDRLLGRVEPHIAGLSCAWQARDFSALGLALEKCAADSDAPDLRASDFKLRLDVVSNSSQQTAHLFDEYVCSKIYEALLEFLTGSDEAAAFKIAKAISFINDTPNYRRFDFIMGLLLIRLQLRRGLVQDAIATADRNLSVYCCPHTQRHHYIALAQQKAASGPAGSANVAVPDLSGRFCDQPFSVLASKAGRYEGADPQLYACGCVGILPYPISNGTDTQSADDIWNGDVVREIRRSILDGDFSYCSKMMCPAIMGGTLPKKDEIADPRLRDIIDNRKVVLDDRPSLVSLAHDPSCNLACPSCRTEIFNIKNVQRQVLARFSDRVLLPLLEDAPVTLYLSSDGDPFGSKHYRQLIRSLDPSRHSRVRLNFLTNGLLLSAREWDELTNIHGKVQVISVSIDAAEAATYEDLRRPGKWRVITQNMENLSRLRREGKVPFVSINFVVQQKNYRQMPAFVGMAQAWGFDKARFQKMFNVSTFTSAEFLENDVSDPRHPEHPELLAILRTPIMQSSEVDLSMLQPYL